MPLRQMIILHLVAADFSDAKIFRLGMREVKSADGTGGPHGETFGQLDARVPFHVEQLPQSALLGVVGAGGITGGGTDAAIFLADQILVA